MALCVIRNADVLVCMDDPRLGDCRRSCITGIMSGILSPLARYS
ncbi:MAG: hypothetical protein ACOY4N_03470 [Pseudomonadota bacterium]|nr:MULTISPECIES: hypothetical protein [Sphingobium]